MQADGQLAKHPARDPANQSANLSLTLCLSLPPSYALSPCLSLSISLFAGALRMKNGHGPDSHRRECRHAHNGEARRPSQASSNTPSSRPVSKPSGRPTKLDPSDQPAVWVAASLPTNESATSKPLFSEGLGRGENREARWARSGEGAENCTPAGEFQSSQASSQGCPASQSGA